MFLFKKLLSACLAPLPLVLGLWVVAAGLFWWRRQRLGRGLAFVGLGVLGLSTCDPVGSALIAPLERRYAPMPRDVKLTDASLRYVVVLGGAARRIAGAAPAVQLNPAALGRLAEGLRIWRALPGAQLVVSGAATGTEVSQAELAGAAAAALGVPRTAIIEEARPRDTESEARFLRERLGPRSIVLVTSAWHMPRAVALFRAQGFDVHPAPCDYTTGNGFGWQDLLPGSRGLGKVERAWHEYLGLAWAWLTGALGR
ncbi:MAG: YdcF family protein [Myxococcales bacterium]|nr:YdcF family protein [Myxococcales bacterium]